MPVYYVLTTYAALHLYSPEHPPPHLRLGEITVTLSQTRLLTALGTRLLHPFLAHDVPCRLHTRIRADLNQQIFIEHLLCVTRVLGTRGPVGSPTEDRPCAGLPAWPIAPAPVQGLVVWPGQAAEEDRRPAVTVLHLRRGVWKAASCLSS